MTSAGDYRTMALECMREADATKDPDRKKTLLGIAKLYNQTALNLEQAAAPEIKPPA